MRWRKDAQELQLLCSNLRICEGFYGVELVRFLKLCWDDINATSRRRSWNDITIREGSEGVVLNVGADRRQVYFRLDPKGCQNARVANAGQLENLRGLDRASSRSVSLVSENRTRKN